ncbi:hypothetical protein CSQ88_21705 [Iodobacter sp. BJB302]|nr:hypothetical protein CSQ88_21705 [Iodobacter sp. BJB302]
MNAQILPDIFCLKFQRQIYFFYNQLIPYQGSKMLIREWVGNTQGQGWQYLYSNLIMSLAQLRLEIPLLDKV